MFFNSEEIRSKILDEYYDTVYQKFLFAKEGEHKLYQKGISYFEKSLEKLWIGDEVNDSLELGGGSGEQERLRGRGHGHHPRSRGRQQQQRRGSAVGGDRCPSPSRQHPPSIRGCAWGQEAVVMVSYIRVIRPVRLDRIQKRPPRAKLHSRRTTL